MKRFICFVLLIIILTGCDSSDQSVDRLFEVLQKEKIVGNNLKLVDTVVDVNAGIAISRKTYYIYEKEDSTLVAINYNSNIYKKNDYDYLVTIYFDVQVDDDIEYLENVSDIDSYFIYDDGQVSEFNKYRFDYDKEYAVYERKPLFLKNKYKVEEII